MIEIENKKFNIFLTPDYELLIERIVFENEWGYKESSSKIFNDTKNPTKIVRILLSKVISLLYESNPPYFFFKSFESSRTILYGRLSKYIEKNSKYTIAVSNKGYFLFNHR